VVPLVLAVAKVTSAVPALLQTTWLEGWFTWPVGFTVIVKVLVDPMQFTDPLLNVGVTTMVAVTGEFPVLMAVKEAISPVPLPAKPILVVLFVQTKVVVPPVLLVPKETREVLALLQTTWLEG
jgi:hypothetical protein